MGRRARPISLSDADRAELERISRSRTEARQLVERTQIILGCCNGEAQNVLAKRLGTRPTTISKWRGRFARLGMKGLRDAPRPGPPKRHVGLREKVLKTLETPPPKGQAAWDGLSLAKTLGAKKSSVYALLQKDGVQLRRKRSWCVSTDSNFAAKAADIIGLYLRPPERALVLSVDEKPSIRRFHERRVTFRRRAAKSCAG
jgi:transposase